ncbi:MAG TPA: N-acetyltransferase [Anaerolinea thermolimosa]|uniref:N-acetyltransferase n=1 Tax=Anaerolinea thermolimosa TaxID=229919 RepID=A0A3D1JEK3_9CHLR|nr:GNAT family N-acetyltransferase [Anaerolinea thermolimosa]GAP05542.1 acetyltransferase [Anaerolinea thermolimosa]HCE16999.1 N-acetyltransferase [Anaerolinea thermolimosa]
MHIEIVESVNDEVVAAFARLMPQLNPSHSPPEQSALEAIVRSEASTLLLARNEAGEVVGTLTLVVFRTPAGVHAWIEDVVVDEKERSRGIGEALTRRAIELAAGQGAGEVNLTSRPEREAANRLYRRLGFQLRHTNLYRLSLRQADESAG